MHDDVSKKLNQWFAQNKRDLPWRRTKDPYAIWISEIMLQQTTVAAVIPYYERFLKTLPTVQSLAQAKEEVVLSLWAGLGYYSRARNLQKAAQHIVEQGSFPSRYQDLLNLPGIGPYTAAAISSIAYEEKKAAVDGNVVRVISRLFDISTDVSQTKTKMEIESHGEKLIAHQKPSQHNQAMMELGATICLPKNPRCLLCPVRSHCHAFKKDTVFLRPVKKKKMPQEVWLWEMHLAQKNNNTWALTQGDNGTPWLNHLWIFPGNAKKWTKKTLPQAHFNHSITKHKIYVRLKKVKAAQVHGRRLQWMKIDQIKNLATSSVVLKAIKHLEKF